MYSIIVVPPPTPGDAGHRSARLRLAPRERLAFDVWAPRHDCLRTDDDHARAEGGPGAAGVQDDAVTAPAFSVDRSTRCFTVPAALCEPRLRGAPHAPLPTVDQAVERLRPDRPTASRASVQWDIDCLAVKPRLEPVPGTAGPGPRRNGEQESPVSPALRLDKGTAGTANVGASSYGADELRTDRGIPPAYRLLIVETAHDCGRKDVTPVLPAAMPKVESDFDPDLSDPVKDEYGIARWTPSVLRWWMNADGTPGETVPEPPFPPAESIPAMGRYLCWIAPRLEPGLPTDPRLLLAAASRTSYRKVNDAGGVPPNYRAYADRVAHYLKEYTPPAGK